MESLKKLMLRRDHIVSITALQLAPIFSLISVLSIILFSLIKPSLVILSISILFICLITLYIFSLVDDKIRLTIENIFISKLKETTHYNKGLNVKIHSQFFGEYTIVITAAESIDTTVNTVAKAIACDMSQKLCLVTPISVSVISKA